MKYLSCKYLEHGIDLEHTRLETCCFTCHPGGGHITLKKPYKGESIDWEEIFNLKRQYREEHRKGNLIPNCMGCIFLEEREWDQEDYINNLQFNHWIACNSNCKYCYLVKNKNIFKNRIPYNSLNIIKNMIEKKILRPGGEISFGGGEPTIAPEFEDIIKLLTENNFKQMRIHSSGIKYSEALEEGIKKQVITVVISIDAGCEKTYRNIKQVNAYKKVLENMKKYAMADKIKYGYIISKYILIPNVNDNRKEIDLWINSVIDCGVRCIAIDIEDIWFTENRKVLSPYYLDLVNYVIDKAISNNLKYELYDRAKSLKEGKNFL